MMITLLRILLGICPTCHAQLERQGFVTDKKSELFEKVQYACSECGSKTWNEDDIPLEIHHNNGNHRDNRKNNLKVVCPNCHSIIGRSSNIIPTLESEAYIDILESSKSFNEAMIKANRSVSGSTYNRLQLLAKEHDMFHLLKINDETIIHIMYEIAKCQTVEDIEEILIERNISFESLLKVIHGTHKYSPEGIDYPVTDISTYIRHNLSNTHYLIPTCKHCGKIISKGAKYCSFCVSTEKVRAERCKVGNRPSRDELKNLIRYNSMCSIGKKYGVSDNTIRKWCKRYSLPYRKADIISYTDEEWDVI